MIILDSELLGPGFIRLHRVLIPLLAVAASSRLELERTRTLRLIGFFLILVQLLVFEDTLRFLSGSNGLTLAMSEPYDKLCALHWFFVKFVALRVPALRVTCHIEESGRHSLVDTRQVQDQESQGRQHLHELKQGGSYGC